MLRIFYFASLFLITLSLNAQVGLSARYISGEGDSWQYQPTGVSEKLIALPGTGWQVGLDYWFRLKNARIEFLPTIAYSQQEQILGFDGNSLTAEANALHFFFNTNIYLFDLKGDCDCPTFSKEGPSLQKGFFLQLSPGYSLYDFAIYDAFADNTYEDSDGAFSLGLGIGIDLGVSDLLTITPQLGARYYPSLTWATLGGNEELTFPAEVAAESTLLQYHAGFRIGLRLDQ